MKPEIIPLSPKLPRFYPTYLTAEDLEHIPEWPVFSRIPHGSDNKRHMITKVGRIPVCVDWSRTADDWPDLHYRVCYRIFLTLSDINLYSKVKTVFHVLRVPDPALMHVPAVLMMDALCD